jgi:4-aminobutyrate aminotransferase-like enzyme
VAVVEKMKEKGFLISYDGQFENVLKIRPPLVFKISHAELFLTCLEETLKEVS